MNKSGYWYLATPYSKYAAGHEQAFIDAALQCAVLLRHGHVVFSLIVHSHPLVVHAAMDGQTDFESWRKVDEVMMERSCGLIVCKLVGWNKSYGVKAELNWFRAKGIEPIFMTPGILPQELR